MDALNAEDLSDVVTLAHAKMRKQGKEPALSPDEAETALRQYYSLFMLSDDRCFAVSAEVDEYWHWHILDTQGYIGMCERVFGRVMHHVPLMPGDEPAFEEVRATYEKSRNILLEHYGNEVSQKAYPPLGGNLADGDIVVCLSMDIMRAA